MKQEKIEKNIVIPVGNLELPGILMLPANTKQLVIFTHGSGSGRFSPRNMYVAKVLHEANIGTLLFDLLTEEEDEIYQNRFDIDLIAGRLIQVTEWLAQYTETKNLAFGYFGASTGAAAALEASVKTHIPIKAIVSRGGRPDLAINALEKVTSPTLLIVGGNDTDVILLNRKAYDKLSCIKQIKIIPGATHLFEESGTLEEAAKLAASWFKKWLK